MIQRMHAVALAVAALSASSAEAGVYITGSMSTEQTTLPFQQVITQSGSASIDVDLGKYVRLGYTYALQKSSTEAYKAPYANPNAPANVTCAGCESTTSITTEVDDSVGLTIILYDGQVFMPFLLAGVIDKFITMQGKDYYYPSTGGVQLESINPPTTNSGPEPYGGGGLGIRLNRDFMLKFSYTVSKGTTELPGQPAHFILDPKSTVGLTYQFL